MLARIVSGAVLALCIAITAAAAQDMKVTFLGTSGGPVAGAERGGSAALLEFGSEVLLIDAGRGLTQQIQRIGRNPGEVTRAFITHLHSDHTVGLPEIWLARWTRARFKPPLDVYGPEGTKSMASHIQSAWQYDVDIRSGPPENMPRNAAVIVGHDVSDGVVYEANGVKVTAMTVDHGPVKTLGYRVDAGGHSISFSGDDIASERLIAGSQNVDVLVHNMAGYTVAELADTGRGGEVRRAAVAMLGNPLQVGSVFARSHPKLAVLVHLNRAQEHIDRLRTVYSGPLEIADDLTQIIIGASITVSKPPLPLPAILAPQPVSPALRPATRPPR